ncbi:hypothetical protein GCM10022419_038570 [Nonomuraea rosea]|uniref:Uncharacterized protein n=2 Tax=Nonomuraea rosea TaxID=638574 RepID=A0ABP6WP00_9ACTN
MMYAMPHGDDLDARFNELVAQIDAEEQRKMRTSAAKGARQARAERRTGRLAGADRARGADRWDRPGAAGPRRIGRAWLAMATITAVLVAGGAVVTFRPELLAPSGVDLDSFSTETGPALNEATVGEPGETGAPEPGQGQAAGPFDGSPAADYAEGAAGFVMPKAKALGGLSKKDVAKGLERARDLLAAAHLDRRTLMGGKPASFMKLLHPDERAQFRAHLDRKGERNTRSWVVSFASKTTELATDVIKVHGASKLSAYKKDGHTGAELTTNYLVVYAVHPPGDPGRTIRLVRHHQGSVLMYRDTRGAVTWVGEWGGSVTPAGCGTRREDGFVRPHYPGSAQDGERPTGTPIDPYDLDQPRLKKCAAANRT